MRRWMLDLEDSKRSISWSLSVELPALLTTRYISAGLSRRVPGSFQTLSYSLVTGCEISLLGCDLHFKKKYNRFCCVYSKW